MSKQVEHSPTIEAIYEQYQIMPTLRHHMYRVSAVAMLVCDGLSNQVEVDRINVRDACLLHDMGNIIKFNLVLFPDFLEPEGLEYWQAVQTEYLNTYGPTVKAATTAIAKEVGAGSRVIELIEAISYANERRNFQSNDFGAKVCAYADMRVAPHGVVTLEERLAEAHVRYARADGSHTYENMMDEFLRKIETQLVENSTQDPRLITEDSIQIIVQALPTFQLGLIE